ncbi:hypothetical protein THRCLA_07201 [Thraustotheca clavata]|uniref:Transmembrane protein n=1 Tax=Thraustotheca clavata TaxID=74557 RepID=A0A1V9ZFQ6_9STRA|nr:hypothetical protein THRCLA_07201 [Thraustotheca clavata]
MVQNDLLWMNFNPTEAQSYLIDTFNKALQTRSDNGATFDVLDPGHATLTPYGSAAETPALNIYPTYSRQYTQWDQRTLEEAIASYRLVDAATCFYIFIEFCYVDLERRWETAHTAARAARCAKDQSKNAAVYMETMLRNLNWDDFIVNWGSEFNFAVTRYVNSTPDGPAWFARTKNAYKDPESELAHWKQYDITYYQTLWHNRFMGGIDEKMVITSALGLESTITLKHISYSDRRALWTTVLEFWGPFDDVGFTAYVKASWVRQAPDFMENIGAGTYEDVLALYPNTPASVIIHTMWGPFLAIDNYLQGPPASLIALVAQFDTFVMTQYGASATFRAAYNAIVGASLDIVPLGWRTPGSVHYGGSPMCPFGGGTTFVQPQFSWDDSCSSELKATFKVTPEIILFGIGVPDTSTAASVCTLAQTTSASCTTIANAAITAWNTLALADPTRANTISTLSIAVTNDVKAMNIEIVQNSKVQGNYTVLHQAILSSSAYDVFGWMELMDWVHGYREVVSFQGDVATFVLMSEPVAPRQFMALPLEVPQASSVYLWAISIFTTIGLVGVSILTFLYILMDRLEFDTRQLFFFNRIVGPVWVGRPLLLVRAFTALLALSTAPVDFVVTDGLSRFQYATRSWFDSLILTAEGTWLTYVVNDFLLVVTGELSILYAPLSSLSVWIITLVWDLAAPVQVTASLKRNCTRTNFDHQVACTSGSVAIGSSTRLLSFIIVNIACIVGALVIGVVIKCILRRSKPRLNWPLLVPASGATFLGTTFETMSSSAAVMCGFFTAKIGNSKWVFDTKLWIIFDANAIAVPSDISTKNVNYSSRKFASLKLNDVTKDKKPEHRYFCGISKQRLKIIGGILYMAASLFGSVSYMTLTKNKMANDFWWASFNASGTFTYLADWFNSQLLIVNQTDKLEITNSSFSELKSFSDPSTSTAFSSIYIRSSVYENDRDLYSAVNGIRNTDACLLPWIATQYCYVNMDKQWEMANSAARQTRCKKYVDNGAIYLESILRNMNWTAFTSCWGSSFELAIAKDLKQDQVGTTWLQTTQSAAALPFKDVTHEVDYWKSKHIVRYTTQWQNYKTHGMIDKFVIQNAFGHEYPMTLKSTNGTFRLSTQTSLKMYWTWASDLWAIASPSTLMNGASLLRKSPTQRGAFTDKSLTMEQILIQNGTFRSPLSIGYQLFHDNIGPFGSVDLWHVPTPLSLTQWYSQAKAIVANALASSFVSGGNKTFPAQRDLLSISLPSQMFPVPPSMDITAYVGWGGNLLCNELPATKTLTQGLWALTGADTACSTALSEGFPTDRMYLLLSALASGVALGDTAANCAAAGQLEMVSPTECTKSISLIAQWALKHIGTATLESLRTEALAVQNDVSKVNVELMQYAQTIATKQNFILRSPIVTSTTGVFDYFAWMYLTDWVSGVREVITFEGDVGVINAITARIQQSSYLVNAQEIPVNASFYFRSLCQYITAVLICVAVIVLVQSFVQKFRNEGLNYFEMNRVAGIVWIGRPLLFVRSMTALALLSTGSLNLTNIGNAAVLESPITEWYTTILAAGEVGWLIYIVNDITMIYTKNLTMHYATVVGLLTWISAAVLSLASPVMPLVQIEKQCQVVQIDFQLVCTSGTVYIGDFNRFLTLVGIVIGLSLLGVIVVRLVCGAPTDTDEQMSFLLPCGAKYLYEKELWVHDGVYYMDLASAAMAGLLILPISSTLYVLDVKSWRVVYIARAECREGLDKHPHAEALAGALPMVM